ncbi:MAG TPA: FMN-binding protein, partial [Longimicrobiales bacterium]|nr:FMN-binding protein [Longimicrobiales bacterium]
MDDRPGGAVKSDGEAGGREVQLPMASGAQADEAAGGGGAGDGVAPGVPGHVDVSSFRLVSTLALAGALAGLVIVLVYQWTQPRILAHQAEVLRQAIYEVLGGPDHYETAFLVDGSFTTRPAPAADTAALDRVYVGYDQAGSPVGVAVAAAEPGFQDLIHLIFGYDPGSGEVVGMKVLEDKETPGLGAKIETDTAFIAGFSGVETPVLGVKAGRETGAANEVDMITGAT